MVKQPRIVNFYIFLTSARMNYLLLEVMGLKILKHNVHVEVVLLRLFRNVFP